MRLAGETLWLLPEHAVWWPDAAMLMLADVHIGKAAAFRALGQPVPHGTTADNLRRLLDLTRQYPVRDLVFLGDFLHARAAANAAERSYVERECWTERRKSYDGYGGVYIRKIRVCD